MNCYQRNSFPGAKHTGLSLFRHRLSNQRTSFTLLVVWLISLLAPANALSAESSLNKLSLSKKTAPLTVSQVILKYGTQSRSTWKERMMKLDAKMTYPPKSSVWICLKEERQLLIFAKDSRDNYRCLKSYPIIGASGVAGPKLKEGDKQVPEGFYKIDGFRPNVIAHLGLSVDYPNSDDRAHAKAEGRKNLGGDILIHGSKWSTGCLAMGNEPIEELFVLAYDAGYKNIELVFAPCNLLVKKPSVISQNEKNQKSDGQQPSWLAELYEKLRVKLQPFGSELGSF